MNAANYLLLTMLMGVTLGVATGVQDKFVLVQYEQPHI